MQTDTLTRCGLCLVICEESLAMRLIDQFVPLPDFREQHHIDVHAPAAVVLDIAAKMDIQTLPVVHALIWIRGKVMGAHDAPRKSTAFLDELKSLGWQVLASVDDGIHVLGVVARPWTADVGFRGVPADRFAAFDEPDLVKIVVTLEAEPIAQGLTRFTTETRVKATDARALRKFRRYWRKVLPGIVLIRLAMLHALKRDAEAAACVIVGA
jgi:hypothetical protein